MEHQMGKIWEHLKQLFDYETPEHRSLKEPAYYDLTEGVESTFVSNVTKVTILFSPNGGCTEFIMRRLNEAKVQILVQAYVLSGVIVTGLTDAKKRDIDVRVMLDDAEATMKWSPIAQLKAAKIPVYLDSKHNIAHNKVMIIDHNIVFTGSFNFTTAAEKSNAENLLCIDDNMIAKVYRANWDTHLSHSIRS
jgi:phosphatidylserine/phosphatidylglycerophosphate/cardiolipin synthase-like enzyme